MELYLFAFETKIQIIWIMAIYGGWGCLCIYLSAWPRTLAFAKQCLWYFIIIVQKYEYLAFKKIFSWASALISYNSSHLVVLKKRKKENCVWEAFLFFFFHTCSVCHCGNSEVEHLVQENPSLWLIIIFLFLWSWHLCIDLKFLVSFFLIQLLSQFWG